METILISGVESVVGANVAATLAERFRVVGVTSNGADRERHGLNVSIDGCETISDAGQTPESIRALVASVRPQWILDCGAAAHSIWEQPKSSEQPQASRLTVRLVHAARQWAAVAAEFACRLTVISSDAVFTGPWMFHREECTCLCESEAARAIRSMEQAVRERVPSALIIRTHAYGWSPGMSEGWLERTLAALETGTAGPFDCLSHATPILATDLAMIVEKAHQQGLTGTYHVAGAERSNPAKFVARLADVFDLPAPRSACMGSLSERPTGYGRGETALHTGKIRKALNVAMPTIADGLERLRVQHDNGYRDRFRIPASALHDRAA